MDHLSSYQPYQVYYGDIHNHCNISYGHGSIEDAYTNARLQLDFASVTGHAWWPDMPKAEGRFKRLVEYHQHGFSKLDSMWNHVQEVTEEFHEEGKFVSFLSFEWHSSAHGDYCFYYKGAKGEIIRKANIEDMRVELRRLKEKGISMMMIPHHICYLAGYRGINWDDFDPEFSPVVEIVSMHGCSEHDDAPKPYLHTMGPRDGRSSLITGLKKGFHFGLIGSTDHHAGHPGSHGHGRMAVWAEDLSRDSLWKAIHDRKTYALTGDKIELAFDLNGAIMGQDAAASDQREMQISLQGENPLDYIEIIRNGEAIHRLSSHEINHQPQNNFIGLIGISVGWGNRPERFEWDVQLYIENGLITRPLPSFKGDVTVSPQNNDQTSYQVSSWNQVDERHIEFKTSTISNPNITTDTTQSFGLHIEGDSKTKIVATINGKTVVYSLIELLDGPRTGYLEGFVSPAYKLWRAVPKDEYCWTTAFLDKRDVSKQDWYYVRVRQKNDQWAWSSPVYVG
jgi:hypothetical protein